jgi:hypothetical protein
LIILLLLAAARGLARAQIVPVLAAAAREVLEQERAYL